MITLRRVLPALGLVAFVSLYSVAAACSSGDNGPTGTAAQNTVTLQATSHSTLTPTPTITGDRQVDVLDSGFTGLRGGLSGGFIAHNKDKTEAVAASYNVSFLDSTGAKVGGTYGTLVLMPDQTAGEAFAGNYSPDSVMVQRVDIQFALSSAAWVALPSTAHLTTTVSSTETQFVHGAVANPFSAASGSLWMSVISYDSVGKINGGNTIAIDSVAANSSANFTAPVPFVGDSYANNARVEAYAAFRDSLPLGITTQ